MKFIVLIAVVLGLFGCSSPKEQPAVGAAEAARKPAPKILEFYATAPRFSKFESSLICYGV